MFVAGDTEETKKFRGQYCGMIVRGAGETFNLIVPIRRMRTWAKAAGCEWAIKNDPNITPPLSVNALSLVLNMNILIIT